VGIHHWKVYQHGTLVSPKVIDILQTEYHPRKRHVVSVMVQKRPDSGDRYRGGFLYAVRVSADAERRERDGLEPRVYRCVKAGIVAGFELLPLAVFHPRRDGVDDMRGGESKPGCDFRVAKSAAVQSSAKILQLMT
jgi:hypothetical protein